MEFFNGSSSSLRPMKRPKEYYDANDTFIVRLPSNLRGSGEAEFHMGKDIFSRSNRYADWGGNEVLSRMQRKYCFSPTNCHTDMNVVKSSQFSCETMAPNRSPATSSGTPKELMVQKSQLNNSPFTSNDMPSWPSPNLTRNGSSNHRNWGTSHLEPMNEWPASQMSPMNNWPAKHFPPNSVAARSYCNNYNTTGTYFRSENKFNNQKNGSQRENNEPFSEFSGGQPPYSQNEEPCREHRYLNSPENKEPSQKFQKEESLREHRYLNSSENKEQSQKFQKEEPHTEFKQLNSPENREKSQKFQKEEPCSEHKQSPENKERSQKLQGSKLLSGLPIYPNEKIMITILQSKNPKCIIFVDLTCHYRFLHNLPHCLPVNVHLIIYFNHFYKFPLFVNASMEQLIKTECLHIHPVSSTRMSMSQQYFVDTINRSHREFPMDVTFILLSGDNPTINGLIKLFLDCERHVIAFMPNFDFSDFYSVLKKCQMSSSLSS